MELAELAERLTGVLWISEFSFTFICPNHPSTTGRAGQPNGKLLCGCAQGCFKDDILKAIEPSPTPPADAEPSSPGPAPRGGLPDPVKAWQRRIRGLIANVIKQDEEFHKPHLTAETALEPLLLTFKPILEGSDLPDWLPPAELSRTEAHEIIELEARGRLEAFYATRPQAVQLMDWEHNAMADEANTEYLKRVPIIERLAYTESTSLLVGPKHGGKTTNVRTVALSVARGIPVWDRQTTKGHVIYVASDDEVASTRMELLRMGWTKEDPILLAHQKPSQVLVNPEAVLEALARKALECGSVLIILDMLFDFAAIKDEMSYAGTRLAIGSIQRLADITKAHVMATHHSPKYMLDTASAATAALGSQGIAARFSPIILARKWGEDVFTIESTMTRDPRGLAITQTCVNVSEQGWAVSAGEFKQWMKWKLYAKRIMGHMEAAEPGTNHTVAGMAKDLEIARPEVQNALYQMFKNGDIDRLKMGRSFKYFLKSGHPDQTVPVDAQ